MAVGIGGPRLHYPMLGDVRWVSGMLTRCGQRSVRWYLHDGSGLRRFRDALVSASSACISRGVLSVASIVGFITLGFGRGAVMSAEANAGAIQWLLGLSC